MACFLGLALLFAACYGFAFGATRLLLRRSPWDQYSLEAAWLTGPALLVLALTLLAYRVPGEIFVWQAWLVLAGGLGLSAAVVVWDRRDLWQLVRAHWLRWLTLTVPAMVGCGVMWSYFQGNVWEEISVPRISEYVNYAEMAATLTGHHQGEPGTPVCPLCVVIRPLRFGQDVIVATVAQLTRRHPIQVIVPVAMVFRGQQTIAIGLLLCSLVRSRRQLLAVFTFLLIEALIMFETVSFASSFLSSNCTMPLFAIYLAWLACQQQFRVRECVIVVLMNLFFLVTYPEFLVFAKALEGLSILIALWRRNRPHWLPLAACNLIVLLMHPLLLYGKLHAVSDQFGYVAISGSSMIGDPLRTPQLLFTSLFGVRLGWGLGNNNNLPLLLLPIVYAPGLCMLTQVPIGLVTLARKHRAGLMLLAWAVALMVIFAFGSAKANCYTGFKILAHTYFLIILGGAMAWFAATPRWRKAGTCLVVLWLASIGFVTYGQLQLVHQTNYVVNYGQFRDAVTRSAKGQEVAALTTCGSPFGMLNMISGETGLPVVAVTRHDKLHFQMLALREARDGTQRPTSDGTCFRGLVVVDAAVLQQGQLDRDDGKLNFECVRVVERVGQLALCEGRIYQTPVPKR